MDKIKFICAETYYIDELVDLIKDYIEEYQNDYDLFDVKYSHLETNHGKARAYLVFKLRKFRD